MNNATGLVSVKVNPINDAPLAVENTVTTNEDTITAINDAIATTEDTPITILASALLSNDMGGIVILIKVETNIA